MDIMGIFRPEMRIPAFRRVPMLQMQRDRLQKRFGMQKSYSIAKMKYTVSSYIINPESLYGNKDFRSIMGYINTNPAAQKKDPKSFASYSNPTV